MEFETAYQAFIKSHLKRRSGPCADRIRNGLNHAERAFLERVWWPAFHHFDELHPEYEIHDFNEGNRYIDFALILPHLRVAIEIDGIGPHWKDISQGQFSDHCNRQNHLVIDGWYVLRFAYFSIEKQPRVCQQTIHHLLGRLSGELNDELWNLNVIDREIIRFMLGSLGAVTVQQVADRIGLGGHATRQHLKRLTSTNWISPAYERQRVHTYKIHSSREHINL